MALTSSKFITVTSNKITLWDKLGTQKIKEITDCYWAKSFVFDKVNNRLWVENYSNNKVRTYIISDTDIVFEYEYTTPSYGGIQSLALNPSTGVCYHVGYGVAGISFTISRMNPITKTINSLTSVPKTTHSSSYASIIYSPITDTVFVHIGYNTTAHTTAAAAYSYEYYEFNENITTYTRFNDLYYTSKNRYGVGEENYIVEAYGYYNYDNRGFIFNPISKKIIYLRSSNYGGTSQYVTVKFIDPITRRIEEFPFDKVQGFYAELFVSELNGNIWIRTSGVTTIIYKYDPYFNYLGEISVMGDINKAVFNPVSETFYIHSTSNKSTFVYNNVGDVINICNVGYEAGQSFAVPSLNESSLSYIEGSVLVAPGNDSIITDDTPTIVFKVGKNPSGYTQQFRLVADTDKAKIITGVATSAYTVILDSFTSSTNYIDATWEYSTDYNSATPTWLPLGTGDGLKQNGSVPTNGVDAATNDIWVRLTIPASKALTGAGSNMDWFFKVYSFSKN